MYDLSLFAGQAPQMSTMIDPNMANGLLSNTSALPTAMPQMSMVPQVPTFDATAFQTAMPQVAQPNMTMANDYGAQNANSFTTNVQNQPSAFGSFFKDAGMKDYATLAGGVGGLYESIKKGQMANEQIRASQDARQYTKDEQARKRDFLNTSGRAMERSNYYSA